MELDAKVFEPHAGSGRNPWRVRPGVMLSGAGQCVESIYAMSLALGDAHKPALIALYEGLYETGYHANPSVLEAAHLFPGAVLQIGLQLPLFNTQGLWAIANGQADRHIARMAARYAALPCSVLLRIGYEFDGAQWNGYEPPAYIAAYRHIAKGLEQAVNVALVWDSYTTDTPNVMDWYPGDDVVDWFGYNTLSPKFDCGEMCALALAHEKPLLNGEASFAQGAQGWSFSRWIEDYFSSMRSHQVQAFQYINWRWQVYPRNANWYDWQDGRITEDAGRMEAYRHALGGPDLVVRGESYGQPLKLVIDCARALTEGAAKVPWRPEADHLTHEESYRLYPEGAQAVYGNGWMGGWTGDEITLHITTPGNFSGALLVKPLAAKPICFSLDGRKVHWQPEDGYLRYHCLPAGETRVTLAGAPVLIDLVAILFYAPNVPSVTGLALEGSTLCWQEVEGAACYSVYVDGSLVGRTVACSILLCHTAKEIAVSAFDARLGEGKPTFLFLED